MDLSNRQIEDRLETEFLQLKKSVKKPNIMLLGATGVGKSTLVNNIFGRDLAQVGTGRPVTQNINCYSFPDAAVVLYDTRGYEVGSQEQQLFLTEVADYAAACLSKTPDQQMHVVWYCIQASGHRILDVDIQTIQRFVSLGIPLAAVLTKCDVVTETEAKQMKEAIQANVTQVPVFLTTATEIPSLGLLDTPLLSDWSMQQLPSGLRIAFLSAQKLNLEAKKKEAAAATVQHVAGAFAVGFTPIPVSDAPILVANQMALIARILFIYDMEYMLKSIQGLVSTMGGGKMISSLGMWTSAQLLKFIPGIGTLVGGLINASVASSITAALGQAMSQLCYRINDYTLNNQQQKLEDLMNNLDQNFQRILKESMG